MSAAFVFGWQLHIVAVEVGKVGIGVGRRIKLSIFKLDALHRKYAVCSVHDAVAIVVERVRGIFVAHFQHTSHVPLQFAPCAFQSEIEELGK